MKHNDNHSFHFLAEIAKENTYRLLFPDPKAGMAIIWLYEKLENGAFPDKFFKESDIHDALLKVSSVNLLIRHGAQLLSLLICLVSASVIA